jgi:hypothetical protein
VGCDQIADRGVEGGASVGSGHQGRYEMRAIVNALR